MTYLYTILISALVSVVSVLGAYNYIPVEPIKLLNENSPMLGATITTIAGSDTLKASRGVINTNFANLNSDKIEVATTTLPNITTLTSLTSATSLASIGTITSGIWNGTAIPVAYGGTGTTTPTSKQIMFGNGSSGLQVIGFGTSGQFLKSGGADTLPSWVSSTFDESADYTFTGTIEFSATTTQSGVYGGLMPVGSITAYASSTPPTGWLSANGASLDTTTYASLFAVVGYTYGGSGANFNIPNLNGRNIIGYGSATTTIDVMGETGGQDTHTQTIAEMPAHSHETIGGTGSGASTAMPYLYPSNGSADASNDYFTDSRGSGTAFNVLDPYIVLRYIIKF